MGVQKYPHGQALASRGGNPERSSMDYAIEFVLVFVAALVALFLTPLASKVTGPKGVI